MIIFTIIVILKISIMKPNLTLMHFIREGTQEEIVYYKN